MVMRDGISIQRDMNLVNKELAKLTVDMNKWNTRRAELELEAAEIREVMFNQQVEEMKKKQAAEAAPKTE